MNVVKQIPIFISTTEKKTLLAHVAYDMLNEFYVRWVCVCVHSTSSTP